jgi:uncharacterized membrane protein YeaQ/YmgE (transglycosylase-associated protein family)
VPDTVSLIIWLIAGLSGGFAVRDLLRRDFDLDPLQNAVAGAVGGVVGAKILELLIPDLGGLDIVPVVGQVIVGAASGAALTVVADAVMRRYRRR